MCYINYELMSSDYIIGNDAFLLKGGSMGIYKLDNKGECKIALEEEGN